MRTIKYDKKMIMPCQLTYQLLGFRNFTVRNLAELLVLNSRSLLLVVNGWRNIVFRVRDRDCLVSGL